MDVQERLLTASQLPQRDRIVELLDAMEKAGYEREAAARGLRKALITPVTKPLTKTGP